MKNIILLAITVIAFTACKQTINESIQTEALAMNSEKVDKTSDWVNLFDGTNKRFTQLIEDIEDISE